MPDPVMRGGALDVVTGRLVEATGYAPSREGGPYKCPAHDDSSPSLSVTNGDGKVLIHCHAGCSIDAILEILKLATADLFDKRQERGERRQVQVCYDYVDERGSRLFQVVRTRGKNGKKTFLQRRPAGSGEWAWHLGACPHKDGKRTCKGHSELSEAVRPVLYRLPQVLQAVADRRRLFVVEGEKDVVSVEALGEVATCNPGGAGKWKRSYTEFLRGAAEVIVVADRDDPGYQHAWDVHDELVAVVGSVMVVEPFEGNDVSDHIAAGHGLDLLDGMDARPPRRAAGKAVEPASATNETIESVDATDVVRETDLGNARRLVQLDGAGLRYVPQWGTWLVWDGQRWRRDVKGEVVERAKSVTTTLWREVAEESDGERRKNLAKWAAQSEAANRIDAMVKLARTEPGIAVEPDELDADPWLLNLASGTVDLRSGAHRPPRPADLLTKLAPVVFDPAATCPAWLAFLARIIPDPSVRQFLQEAVGYALTGTTSEQVLFFAYGSGANGKSTLTDTLQALLGDYARQAAPDLLLARQDAHPTGVADLHGARLVVATEVEEGRRLGEATVKQLTGGDRIKARFMRQDFFEFTPTHKFFLHGNHRPVVRGTDHAIWRRLRLIPFTVTIPDEEQDRHLVERLRGELPGILRWAIEGCLRWQRHGLSEPDAVLAATSAYRREMDSLGGFLEEHCVMAEHAQASAASLYQAYKAWLDENGEESVSQKAFGSALADRGFESRKAGPKRRAHWFGIGLLNARTDENGTSCINGHMRAHGSGTGEKGSDGFMGSSVVHLDYAEAER